VQRSAVISLGLLTSRSDKLCSKVVQKLKSLVKKGRDYQSKCWALLSLARIGGNSIRQFLLKSLNSTRGNLKAFAGLALAIQASRENEDVKIISAGLEEALMEEKDSSIRAALCISLGIIKDKKMADVIKKIAIENGDPSLREFASISLGMMEARGAANDLASLLEKEQKPYIIRSTAISLGLLAERKIVSLLINIMNKTGNLTLKSAATLALGYVGDRKSLEPLVHLLTNGKKHYERSFAAIALGKIGERSDIPILSALSRDMNYRALSPSLFEALYIY